MPLTSRLRPSKPSSDPSAAAAHAILSRSLDVFVWPVFFTLAISSAMRQLFTAATKLLSLRYADAWISNASWSLGCCFKSKVVICKACNIRKFLERGKHQWSQRWTGSTARDWLHGIGLHYCHLDTSLVWPFSRAVLAFARWTAFSGGSWVCKVLLNPAAFLLLSSLYSLGSVSAPVSETIEASTLTKQSIRSYKKFDAIMSQLFSKRKNCKCGIDCITLESTFLNTPISPGQASCPLIALAEMMWLRQMRFAKCIHWQ